MPLTVSGQGYRVFSEPRFFECETQSQVQTIRAPVNKSHAFVAAADGTSNLTVWKFDSESTDVASATVIIPDNPEYVSAGRWISLGNTGGGAGAGDLIAANNLSDLVNFGTARSNLGVPPLTRIINTTAPLTGGGDLSADRTLAMAASTNGVDGYLTAADHTSFAAKVSSSRLINTTAPITGGGDLSANRTLAMAAATDSVPGFMTAADHALLTGAVAAKIPTGGTAGQVLSKIDSTNFNTQWVTLAVYVILINSLGASGSGGVYSSHVQSDQGNYKTVSPRTSYTTSVV